MEKERTKIEERLIENILKAMNDKGWIRSRLATEADMSEQAISKIIHGDQRLTLVYLSKIAKALSLREIDLFTYPDIYVKQDESGSGPTEVLLQLRLTKDKKEQVLKLIFGESCIDILNK